MSKLEHALVVGSLLLAWLPTASAQNAVAVGGRQVQPPAARQIAPAERVDEVLREPTQLEFIDTPLTDVIEYLNDLHRIQIQFDRRALKEAEIAPDSPITRNLRAIPLATALRLLLDEYGLTYVVRDGLLIITTPEAAEQFIEVRVYDIGSLAAVETLGSDISNKLEAILQPKVQAVSPGPYVAPAPVAVVQAEPTISMVRVDNLLVVRAPYHKHQELQRLLDEMQAKLDLPARANAE